MSLDAAPARQDPPFLPAPPQDRQPFRHLPATVLDDVLRHCPGRRRFIRSWDRLPVDQYMRDDGDYRLRRYSRFRIAGRELLPEPHRAFFQPLDVNATNGGVPRLFAPLESAVARSAALRATVLALLNHLPGDGDPVGLACGVHQIRIIASPTGPGQPTPEGIHQDGHHFVGQVLIHRGAVTGGESTIYDLDLSPIYRTTLRTPMETIVIDDRRVLHSVEPIRVASDNSRAVRDMLLVDFFPADDHSAHSGRDA